MQKDKTNVAVEDRKLITAHIKLLQYVAERAVSAVKLQRSF